MGERDPMVDDFRVSDEMLLNRAVRTARRHDLRKGVKHPRWTAVMETFALGSTYAHVLCRRFNFDPDEMVSR